MQFFWHKYTIDLAEPLSENDMSMTTQVMSRGDSARSTVYLSNKLHPEYS